MRLLAIETSGRKGSFAVVEDDHLLSECLAEPAGQLVERGVERVGEVLERASTRIEDLDGVAVSLGPGSFTGLRVGLAIAKGICFGRGLPLVGVPTLDAIAGALSDSVGYIIPVLDARRGEIYFSIYRSDGSAATRQSDYLVLPPDGVADRINRLGSETGILFAGNALARYGQALRSALSAPSTVASDECWEASAEVIGKLGLGLLDQGKTLDLATAEPLYIRPSEAERKTMGMTGHGAINPEDKKND
jgi:tRNA threonylcarbamoyladenosine biosynthesis protein TsaB